MAQGVWSRVSTLPQHPRYLAALATSSTPHSSPNRAAPRPPQAPPPSLGSSTIVEEAYTSIRVEPGKGDGAISDRAAARLNGLLAWRRALDADSLDEFAEAQKRKKEKEGPLGELK